MSRLMYSLLGAAIGSGITYALLKDKTEEPDATRSHTAEADEVKPENTNEDEQLSDESEPLATEGLSQLREQCDSLLEQATVLVDSFEDMQKQSEENLALIESMEVEEDANEADSESLDRSEKEYGHFTTIERRLSESTQRLVDSVAKLANNATKV